MRHFTIQTRKEVSPVNQAIFDNLKGRACKQLHSREAVEHVYEEKTRYRVLRCERRSTDRHRLE